MMRLFIGVGLPDDARQALHAAVAGLGVEGRMAQRENYHLTLAFLGERDGGLRPLQSVLTGAARAHAPFWLSIAGYGFFGRRDGALLHARLNPSPHLGSLAASVRAMLREAGEPYDPKPFAAHITLARQADLRDADLKIPLPPIEFPVHTLALYHSARVKGVLRYLPVGEAPLGKEGTEG